MKNLHLVLLLCVLMISSQAQEKKLADFLKSQHSRYELTRVGDTRAAISGIDFVYDGFEEKEQFLIKERTNRVRSNSNEKKVYTRITLWRYSFADQASYDAAVDSLIRCYPFDCTLIPTSGTQKVKTDPAVYILSENSIYVARTRCATQNDKWKSFRGEFMRFFSDQNSSILIASCDSIIWQGKVLDKATENTSAETIAAADESDDQKVKDTVIADTTPTVAYEAIVVEPIYQKRFDDGIEPHPGVFAIRSFQIPNVSESVMVSLAKEAAEQEAIASKSRKINFPNLKLPELKFPGLSKRDGDKTIKDIKESVDITTPQIEDPEPSVAVDQTSPSSNNNSISDQKAPTTTVDDPTENYTSIGDQKTPTTTVDDPTENYTSISDQKTPTTTVDDPTENYTSIGDQKAPTTTVDDPTENYTSIGDQKASTTTVDDPNENRSAPTDNNYSQPIANNTGAAENDMTNSSAWESNAESATSNAYQEQQLYAAQQEAAYNLKLLEEERSRQEEEWFRREEEWRKKEAEWKRQQEEVEREKQRLERETANRKQFYNTNPSSDYDYEPRVNTKIGSTIGGDFNGDGKPENARIINIYDDETARYYEVRFSGGIIEPLDIGCCNVKLVNEGDLNGNGTDEISVYKAPFNGCDYTMETYTLENGFWVMYVPTFIIPEGCKKLSNSQLSSRIYKSNGSIYYLDILPDNPRSLQPVRVYIQ